MLTWLLLREMLLGGHLSACLHPHQRTPLGRQQIVLIWLLLCEMLSGAYVSACLHPHQSTFLGHQQIVLTWRLRRETFAAPLRWKFGGEGYLIAVLFWRSKVCCLSCHSSSSKQEVSRSGKGVCCGPEHRCWVDPSALDPPVCGAAHHVPAGAEEVLRNLKAVWISHIHADHHAGLPRSAAAS